jgi:hypothetical protein
MNTKTTNASDTKQPQTTNTKESRRDDDQFSNDWWREFAETWK